MRHVNSFLLSLVMAPAVWALAGFGLVAYGRAGTRPDGELSPERLTGLAALLVAGLIVAVLTVARLSPVGPTLTGLGYLAVAGWVAAHPALTHQWVRDLALPFGAAELVRPAEGYAALLGVPLVATAFSPGRWRRFARPPALYAGPTSPAAPGAEAPGFGRPAPAGADPWSDRPIWESNWQPATVWQPPPGWRNPPAIAPSSPALPMHPVGPVPDGNGAHTADLADTADLTADLLPLRSPHPPAR